MSWRDVVARRAEREDRENRELPPLLRSTDGPAWFWFLLLDGLFLVGMLLAFVADRLHLGIALLVAAVLAIAFTLRVRSRTKV